MTKVLKLVENTIFVNVADLNQLILKDVNYVLKRLEQFKWNKS